jgi:hypothetical protein
MTSIEFIVSTNFLVKLIFNTNMCVCVVLVGGRLEFTGVAVSKAINAYIKSVRDQ